MIQQCSKCGQINKQHSSWCPEKTKRVSDGADKLVLCPDCGEPVDVDYTPEFNAQKPYERVCYACGWFDEKRYASMEEAQTENDTDEARSKTGD